MKIIASKYLFDGEGLLENKAILIDSNNVVREIVDQYEIKLSGAACHYLGDGVITPGFIDLQVNGCGGVAFNQDISGNTLETMYQTWQQFGTVGFLPTLITSTFAEVLQALDVIKEWFSKYGGQRGVLGIHLEGPFIAKEKCGIHPIEHILKPTDELLKQIVAYRKYFPIKMTVAVEVFFPEQLKFLIDNGIILSLGHSNASYEEASQAISYGVQTATHIFNAMSGLTARNPGVIAAILNHEIYTGVIADLVHVDHANIELVCKLKKDHVYLVTDAVTPTATNMLQFYFAQKSLYVQDGKCVDADGVLGGAYLTMNQAVLNCVNHCDIPLADALRMATTIPAEVMQLPKTNHIESGVTANNIIYLDLNTAACYPLD